MKTIRRDVAMAAVFLAISCQSATAQKIPEVFEAVVAGAPNSIEFAKQCVATVTPETLMRMVSDTAQRTTTVVRPSDRSLAYLAVSNGKIFCVRMSDRKYPILPLEAFAETIEFGDMAKDEVQRLRTDLATQVANSGYATAMILYDNGNANQVVYMLAADRPNKFYFHSNFMKKGEFSVAPSTPTYAGSAGGMTVTARGNPAEQVKFFFSK
ncbi:MAG: hypothetical protein V4625_10930 [Pseudomonadota bacterium]